MFRQEAVEVLSTQSCYESLWSSDNPSDLARLYYSSRGIEDLIRFSRLRPRAFTRTFTTTGAIYPQIVAVIPTADANKTKKSSLFHALGAISVVLVESSGPFFNYSHSVNVGIEEALRLGAEWVVIANDDMSPIDDAEALVREIHSHSEFPYLLALPDNNLFRSFHTFETAIFSVVRPWEYVIGVSDGIRHLDFDLQMTFVRQRYLKYHFRFFQVNCNPSLDSNSTMSRWLRTHITYLREGPYSWISPLAQPFINFGDFGVFNATLFNRCGLDETFINGGEDLDLSFRLASKGIKPKIIRFAVQSLGGKSLSFDRESKRTRQMRDTFNLAYFCHKHTNILMPKADKGRRFRESV